MPTPNPFLTNLQALQAQLPALLGDQATTVSQQLDTLLQAAAQNPQDPTLPTRLNLLLRHHPAAQTWLTQQNITQQDALPTNTPQQDTPEETERTAKGVSPESYGVTRGFDPLAGNPAPVATDQYICPQCNATYFRRGASIPTCDRHHPPVTCIAVEKHTP